MSDDEKKECLARALAQICGPLCQVGLGMIQLGELARHMLVYRTKDAKTAKRKGKKR